MCLAHSVLDTLRRAVTVHTPCNTRSCYASPPTAHCISTCTYSCVATRQSASSASLAPHVVMKMSHTIDRRRIAQRCLLLLAWGVHNNCHEQLLQPGESVLRAIVYQRGHDHLMFSCAYSKAFVVTMCAVCMLSPVPCIHIDQVRFSFRICKH